MANVNTAWPQNHIGFLGANCSQYPVGSVIIASSKRRSITTPSRRRRIIFETARSITHLYIEKSLHKHIQEVDASIILQTYVRGHAARNEFQSILKLRDEACIRIQSQVRSQQAIKTFKVLLNDNLSYEQSHAATTIAAVFRRKKAIDLAQRRSLEKARKAEMNAMVIKAQTFLRGALARKKVEEMRLLELHMECAAIVIQSFVRTVFTKHTYVSTRYREHVEPSVILVQRALRRYQAISRRRTLMQSVVRLQIWWRDIVVHLKTAAVFNVKNFSSICSSSIHSINSAKTPELDQEETQRLLSPETKPEEQILETFGAFSSEFETPTTSSVDISSIQSDDTCVVIEPDEESLHSEKNETQNAAIIQQAFRTFYQRKKMAFLAQQTANDSINLATELVLDYRWDLLIFAAATKVQALVRGYSDRRKVSFRVSRQH